MTVQVGALPRVAEDPMGSVEDELGRDPHDHILAQISCSHPTGARSVGGLLEEHTPCSSALVSGSMSAAFPASGHRFGKPQGTGGRWPAARLAAPRRQWP